MYSNIAANKRKSVLLILIFLVVIGAIGWIFGQIQNTPTIFIGVLIFALVYAALGYYFSARIALAMTGAKQIEKRDNPRLWRTVENLAITAGLPMPKVYIINDPAPNAFATGHNPDDAAIAATTGLLDMLDNNELEGVIAHELSHVGNYDIRVMGLVIVLVTVIAFLSDIFLRMTIWGGNDSNKSGGLVILIGLAVAIIAPLIAMLLRLAVSRQREYLADSSGILLTRYPEGLQSALEKIGSYKKPMKQASNATAHLFFANPLKGKSAKGLSHLFSTHPPIEKRIQRLQEAGRGL